MITLMGILLALTIFVISNLSADIINLDTVISNERATSMLSEFAYIKETFGKSLNYNLINNVSMKDDKLVFTGNPDGIVENFTKTEDEFYTLELQYGNNFDAKLNRYWYSHAANEDDVYYIDATIKLDDEKTYLSENVLYSIVCKTKLT